MEHFRRLGFAEEIRALGLPPDYPTDIAYFTRFARHELARFSLPSAREARGDGERRCRARGARRSCRIACRRSSSRRCCAGRPRRCPAIDAALRLAPDGFVDDGRDVDAEVERGRRTAGARRIARGLPRRRRRSAQHRAPAARLALRAARPASQRDFMGGRMFAVYLRAARPSTTPCRTPPAWMNVTFNHERRAFMAAVDGRASSPSTPSCAPARTKTRSPTATRARMFQRAVGRRVPVEILSRGTWTAGHCAGRRALRSGPRVHRRRRRAPVHADRRARLQHGDRGCGQPRLEARRRAEGQAPRRRCWTATRPSASRSRGATPPMRAASPIRSASSQPPPEIEEETPRRRRGARRAPASYLAPTRAPNSTFPASRSAAATTARRSSSPTAPRRRPTAPTSTSRRACPGGRPPHAWLADGRSLYDRFGFEWTLLRLGGAPDARRSRRRRGRSRLDLKLVKLETPKRANSTAPTSR